MSEISRLQDSLEQFADPKTKAWWEAYMRGAVAFRGVKMADIRTAMHGWARDEGITRRPVDEQRNLALSLMRLAYCEDKLAGVLFMQEILLPARAILWPADLPRFATLFEEGHINDWNTCDWFCVRVLGPLAHTEGEPCARAIASWRDAQNLWQRRASGVAFVNLAKHGERNFPGFTGMLLDVCAATVRSPERFAQTGTGWALRELSHAEPQQVTAFVEAHLAELSAEALKYATAKLPQNIQLRLKHLHKAGRT